MLKSIAVIAVLAILAISVSVVNASIPTYYNAGIVVGANASITKVVNMQGERELAIILKKSSGNFNSQLLNVSASADNSTFYKVDSVSAGTGNTKVLQYSDGNKGATLAINPSVFPFLKIEFPRIINNTVTLTYSTVRG